MSRQVVIMSRCKYVTVVNISRCKNVTGVANIPSDGNRVPPVGNREPPPMEIEYPPMEIRGCIINNIVLTKYKRRIIMNTRERYSNNELANMYLDYVNNYLTVDKLAEDHDLTYLEALDVINIGHSIHETNIQMGI